MVWYKRIDYGFNGYQVPPIPRAPRSARRRGSYWKKFENRFDLLAIVAGRLLEGESSPSSTDMLSEIGLAVSVKDSVKKELDIDNAMQNETWDDKTYDGCSVVSELVSQAPFLDHSLKECPNAQNEICSGLAPIITILDCQENAGSTELVKVETKIELGCSSSNVDVGSSSSGVLSICRLEDASKNQIKNEVPNDGNGSTHGVEACTSKGLVVFDRKCSVLVGLENNVKLPICTDQIYGGSYPNRGNNVKLVVKDDDEKISGCSQTSSENKAYRPSPRIGDGRIRKLMASKYSKIPSELKVEESVNTGAEIMHVYHNRKSCFRSQRSQRDYPFKKRKLYRYNALSSSGGGINRGGIPSSSWKAFNEDIYSSGTEVHSASGTSTSRPGHHCLQSRDSHVKLKIKSFRVPELFIEILETATVGNLKRAVMETVTSILGGELRVGVLHQGKDIGDDNKTLLQTGISCDDRLDSLGFTLEPDPSQAPQPLCPLLLPCDASEPLVRYVPAHNVARKGTPDISTAQQMTNFGTLIGTNHDSVPSPPDISIGKAASYSRALIAVPAMKVEALTGVPMRKLKRSEAVQRHIRRPFSISEVEVLVQAVEKLGTGRWRDVKLRAFENAKHRTYMDLKDKWKTLVHTAKISPQQRRGEPVPQELLDRVLTTHAYWSQQQTKQQLKQQQALNCFSFETFSIEGQHDTGVTCTDK